jgi:Fic family protein
MQPPYVITPAILQLIATISEKIGQINAIHLSKPPTELRKKNRIQTIQSSLEIEGNTLTEQQITALLENKRVLAPQKDILEVKNAIAVYNVLHEWKPYNLSSFLKAHGLLMKDLIAAAGKLRTKAVGIVKGSQITHVAPPGPMVKPLLNDLFSYLKKSPDLLLIKSCVFHYELEFIHPFTEGNVRMGRLWQTILLKEQYPVFEYLPVEMIIKNRQEEYYGALSNSDKSGSSTVFIEFMLQVIDEALNNLLSMQNVTLTSNDRISLFETIIADHPFSRQEYLKAFKEISPATASRDLKEAVEKKLLKKNGDKRTTLYQFKKDS